MWAATRLEYRFRYALHFVLFLLGFTTPWNEAIHLDPPGPNAHLWGLLSADLARITGMNIAASFDTLLVAGIVLAVAGAALRTWGSAYLGSDVVQSRNMHTAEAAPVSGMVEDGPFRHVRNPLYLGTMLHTLALALLMPLSGAVFTIGMMAVLQLRLILAEEPFLTARLGAPYLAYCALVPRLWPSLRPRVAAAGLVPRWPQAFLGEVYFWGVAGSLAVAGWSYNTWPLTKCVIVSAGVSMVVRALMPRAVGG
jgi:protein-S-isoprenylcysteine O-methyltransferase Ste14